MASYYEIQVRCPSSSLGWSNDSAKLLPGLPQSANRWHDQASGLAAIADICATTKRPQSDYRLIEVKVLVGGGCF